MVHMNSTALVVRTQALACKPAWVVRRQCAGQEVHTRASVVNVTDGMMAEDRRQLKVVHSLPLGYQSAVLLDRKVTIPGDCDVARALRDDPPVVVQIRHELVVDHIAGLARRIPYGVLEEEYPEAVVDMCWLLVVRI